MKKKQQMGKENEKTKVKDDADVKPEREEHK